MSNASSSPDPTRHSCPHCGSALAQFRMPSEGGGWDDTIQFACFNDDCPYYREGWQWMRQTYSVDASYRYRLVDSEQGTASPLAVWSPTALRNLIVEDPDPSRGS